MPDIFHDFTIAGKRGAVFKAITTPPGLDEWWTKTSSGEARSGAIYELGFGPGFDWRGRVTTIVPNETFELQMIQAERDWTDTRVRFDLAAGSGVTQVHFRHVGWPSANDHYRISCYCWAMYLRILRRYVEHSERVPYEKRLDV
jgi:uncharacterized protein YndB with AHSA1/START domain